MKVIDLFAGGRRVLRRCDHGWLRSCMGRQPLAGCPRVACRQPPNRSTRVPGPAPGTLGAGSEARPYDRRRRPRRASEPGAHVPGAGPQPGAADAEPAAAAAHPGAQLHRPEQRQLATHTGFGLGWPSTWGERWLTQTHRRARPARVKRTRKNAAERRAQSMWMILRTMERRQEAPASTGVEAAVYHSPGARKRLMAKGFSLTAC